MTSGFNRRRTLLAVSCVFLFDGGIVGAWAVRVAEVQREHGLSETGLGAALICVGLGAILAMGPVGVLATRYGSAACIRVLIVIAAFAPVLAAASGSIPLLLLGLALLGFGIGGLDVSMSTQAVALERSMDRPLMSTLHALFSAGYLFSALVGGLVAGSGMGVTPHLAIVGGVAAATILGTSRWLVYDRPPKEKHAGFDFPSRNLLILGLIAFGAFLTEGSITDWLSVYVKTILEASPTIAGAALATFGTGMAVSRFTGDHLRSRFGPYALVTLGALLTTATLALVLLASNSTVTIIALLFTGLGLGNCFPVSLAAAGSIPNKSGVAASVASVATLGYTGFLLGPALIGLLTTVVSLSVALCALVVAMIAVVLLAPVVRAAPR